MKTRCYDSGEEFMEGAPNATKLCDVDTCEQIGMIFAKNNLLQKFSKKEG